ncbi:40S ribosomal protein S19 protein, putative [Leishmania tarentolae]|uniref:40S ribosomal protein S19 protein, putative n=1 Tax=Leishmania tarentolae TaxID=5689 RepID=A0A640KTI9_LEITA|nr:40S ribosomal protein S19 protein, putative [Leishmania tarentolae]
MYRYAPITHVLSGSGILENGDEFILHHGCSQEQDPSHRQEEGCDPEGRQCVALDQDGSSPLQTGGEDLCTKLHRDHEELPRPRTCTAEPGLVLHPVCRRSARHLPAPGSGLRRPQQALWQQEELRQPSRAHCEVLHRPPPLGLQVADEARSRGAWCAVWSAPYTQGPQVRGLPGFPGSHPQVWCQQVGSFVDNRSRSVGLCIMRACVAKQQKEGGGQSKVRRGFRSHLSLRRSPCFRSRRDTS